MHRLQCLSRLFLSFIIFDCSAHWMKYKSLKNTSNSSLLSEAAGLKHFVHHRGAWWHQVHFQLCVFPYDKRWHTSTDASQSDIISVLAQWVSHLKWMSPWSALNIRRSFYSSPWRDPMWTRGRLVQVHVFLWHAWNYDFFLSSYRHLLGKTNQNSWELSLMRFSLEQVHLWSSVS